MEKKLEQITLTGEVGRAQLAAAITALKSGGTIRLERVILRLSKRLIVRKSIGLLADHPDSSWLVGEGPEFGLVFRGPGPWKLSNFSVAQCGLKVESGSVDVQGCRFVNHPRGTGLHIEGDTRGSVTHCEATGTGRGLVLSGHCDLLVAHNHCHHNGDGIIFQERATGAALKNDCPHNTGHGLWITALAKPTLDEHFRAETVVPEALEEVDEEVEEEDAFEQLLSRGLQDGLVTLDDIQETFAEYGLTPEMFDRLVERLAEEGIEVVADEEGGD